MTGMGHTHYTTPEVECVADVRHIVGIEEA